MSLLATTNLPESLISRLPRKGVNEAVADNILDLIPLITAEGANVTKTNVMLAYFNTHGVELKQGTIDSTMFKLESDGLLSSAKVAGQGKMKVYSLVEA
jgi:hypothetical protein